MRFTAMVLIQTIMSLVLTVAFWIFNGNHLPGYLDEFLGFLTVGLAPIIIFWRERLVVRIVFGILGFMINVAVSLYIYLKFFYLH